jgi:hypothetical protein
MGEDQSGHKAKLKYSGEERVTFIFFHLSMNSVNQGRRVGETYARGSGDQEQSQERTGLEEEEAVAARLPRDG